MSGNSNSFRNVFSYFDVTLFQKIRCCIDTLLISSASEIRVTHTHPQACPSSSTHRTHGRTLTAGPSPAMECRQQVVELTLEGHFHFWQYFTINHWRFLKTHGKKRGIKISNGQNSELKNIDFTNLLSKRWTLQNVLLEIINLQIENLVFIDTGVDLN